MHRGLPTKDEFAARFARHPWAEQTVLVFLYDRRFRWVIILAALVALAITLCLLRIWRVTPPDFKPPVRINVLDLFQSRSLLRTAREHLRKRQYTEAVHTWAMAVSNDPGNTPLLREYLGLLAEYGDPRVEARQAIRHTNWLLMLTRTNLADLELTSSLLQRYRLDDLVLQKLEAIETPLSPALQVIKAKSTLLMGDAMAFAQQQAALLNLPEAAADPEFALCQDAFRAGWTEGTTAVDAQSRLDQAKENPNLMLLAHRLQLVISHHRREPAAYGKALEALDQRSASRLSDHLLFCQLLRTIGERETAIQHLHAHAFAPRSADETVLLARCYYELGLPDEARTVLQRFAPEFAEADNLWLTYANLLIDQKRWNDLADLGVRLHTTLWRAHFDFVAFGHYIEGYALQRLGRESQALQAFDRLSPIPVTSVLLGAKIAAGLEELGHTDRAQRVLASLRQHAEHDPDYWHLVARTAYRLRDTSLLVYATGALLRLRPDHPAALQDHAAALLTSRTLPSEAIRYTFLLLEQQPDLLGARLNHAAALAQNQRLTEARKMLETIDPASLNAAHRNAWLQVWFEIHFQERDYPHALATEKLIDRHALFPVETRWLDDSLEIVRRHTGATNPPPSTSSPP
ncbi:MAG TPA: tetratricopeptide repeat protein [Verrucomicrobiota bacterium]|nr:tetratricopeptide repeat protein [Verrucomicrobiota bacterium]HNU49931.1 tetratricopeptide repeat protein [Verrucomicrobiota bacterium]